MDFWGLFCNTALVLGKKLCRRIFCTLSYSTLRFVAAWVVELEFPTPLTSFLVLNLPVFQHSIQLKTLKVNVFVQKLGIHIAFSSFCSCHFVISLSAQLDQIIYKNQLRKNYATFTDTFIKIHVNRFNINVESWLHKANVKPFSHALKHIRIVWSSSTIQICKFSSYRGNFLSYPYAINLWQMQSFDHKRLYCVWWDW